MHALWSCKNILTVWEANLGWVRKDFLTVVSFLDLVSLVGDHSKRLELFASVAWSIWCRRNKLRCNELCVPLEKILESAASLLTEFQKHFNQAAHNPRSRNVKWKPPTAATMWKTNFNRVMFPESDQAGIGVVIRNQAGQVMAALSERIQKPGSAEIMEALVARMAVQFILELGFKQSEFEGDSEGIIKAFVNKVFSSLSVGHIVKDIWSMSGLLQTKSFS